MAMIDRFKEYLVGEFRTIAPSKEAMDYRKEVLGNLLDKAQELRIKGMTDEDAIYNACIDSLGDFRDTLQAFDSKRVMIKKSAAKAKIGVLSAALAALMVVAIYLIVSFVIPGSWGVTWLILVGGAFAGVIGILSLVSVKAVKKGKYSPLHLSVVASLVLAFVFCFLCAQIIFNAPNAWFTFLVMVIAVLVADAALGFLVPTNKVIRTIVLLFAVIVTCVMLFVMLGVAGVMPWHPGWLLIIGGVVIAIAILIAMAVLSKKKKEAVEGKGKEYDEDFYTNWD